ncbi:sugar phosphate nucleotidyltransferase [Patescibacteria group bacterium]
MKCILLAAGEGTRMRPLTNECPKSLLKASGKPLVEHILSKLPKEVDEFIFVIGHLGNMIKDYCGDNFLGRPVKYILQEEKLGTYHAVALAKDFIKPGERFLVLYGDDLHGKKGIEECIKHPRALLVKEVENPRAYGVVELDENANVKNVIEKPENPSSNLISTGVLVLDHHIFEFPPELSSRGEYFLTDAMQKMLAKYPIKAVRSSFWFAVTTPENLKTAEKAVLDPQFES